MVNSGAIIRKDVVRDVLAVTIAIRAGMLLR